MLSRPRSSGRRYHRHVGQIQCCGLVLGSQSPVQEHLSRQPGRLMKRMLGQTISEELDCPPHIMRVDMLPGSFQPMLAMVII